MSKIEINSLTKQFDEKLVLNNINLNIEENKIYGLLGRNGAGKTTLLNLVCNKLFPTDGKVLIDNELVIENESVLKKIFYMQEMNLYPLGYRIKDVFRWTKVFYPKFDFEYAEKLCGKFSLDSNLKIKALSTGYKTIFKDIIAMASNADILLMDEPVLGLDANHREMLYKEILANFIEHPKIIIISTHLIEEVADIIEEVLIIKNGEIILSDSRENIAERYYLVSGQSSNVEKYLVNKKYTVVETMGKYKSVIVNEDFNQKNTDLINEFDLEVSKVALQKLFISLTN